MESVDVQNVVVAKVAKVAATFREARCVYGSNTNPPASDGAVPASSRE